MLFVDKRLGAADVCRGNSESVSHFSITIGECAHVAAGRGVEGWLFLKTFGIFDFGTEQELAVEHVWRRCVWIRTHRMHWPQVIRANVIVRQLWRILDGTRGFFPRDSKPVGGRWPRD